MILHKTWKEEVREEINKKFFAGIPTEEMGSNQVDEEDLLDYIFSKFSTREEELREMVKGMRDEYDQDDMIKYAALDDLLAKMERE